MRHLLNSFNAMLSYEVLLVYAAILLLVLYHLRLFWMINYHPLKTDIGVNACVRRHWVETMMQRPVGDVLAVQTLRNTLMSASFFASSAILLVAGILSFATSEKNLENFGQVLELLGGVSNPHRVHVRFLGLIALFFFAFFNFLISMRYFNHLGFMLNAVKAGARVLPPALVANSMRRGNLHFTLGIRALMMVLPFGLWLLGSVWLMAGSVLLCVILWPIDYPHYLKYHYAPNDIEGLNKRESS